MYEKITFSIAWPLSGLDVRELLSFAFQVSLVSFLGFYLVESLRGGFIANFSTSTFFVGSDSYWRTLNCVANGGTRSESGEKTNLERLFVDGSARSGYGGVGVV